MKYKNSQELPFNISETSADLWTIFESCPIERGNVNIYNMFALEREKVFNEMLRKEKAQREDLSMDF